MKQIVKFILIVFVISTASAIAQAKWRLNAPKSEDQSTFTVDVQNFSIEDGILRYTSCTSEVPRVTFRFDNETNERYAAVDLPECRISKHKKTNYDLVYNLDRLVEDEAHEQFTYDYKYIIVEQEVEWGR